MKVIIMAIVKTLNTDAIINILLSIAEYLAKRTKGELDDLIVTELKKIFNKG